MRKRQPSIPPRLKPRPAAGHSSLLLSLLFVRACGKKGSVNRRIDQSWCWDPAAADHCVSTKASGSLSDRVAGANGRPAARSTAPRIWGACYIYERKVFAARQCFWQTLVVVLGSDE